MIKKAIIAAAGRGTRFLPVTKAYPKELLPVGNKPIIHLLIEELVNSGIYEIAVVHRWDSELVPKYFRKDVKLSRFLRKNGKENSLNELEKLVSKIKQLNFIPQSEKLPYGTGAPILAAEKFLQKDSFIYIYGDDLILEKNIGSFLSSMIKLFNKTSAAAILGAQKVEWNKVSSYGTLRLKNRNGLKEVAEIAEKRTRNTAPSNLALFGRFAFSTLIIDEIKNIIPSRGQELMLTQAITNLCKQNLVLGHSLKNGRWLTTGDPENWHKANIEFLSLLKHST